MNRDYSTNMDKETELNKFRVALDHSPSAVFIMDKNWSFEYINSQFEKLSGFTKEEILNKNISDTIYKNITGIPESRRELIDCLREGKSWKGELYTINKNGSTYWAETTASPYRNENGEVDGYIIIQHDITDKKNLEKSAGESEDKYRTLVEYSQDGIAIVQDEQFKFVNQAMCKILGYTPQEFYEMKGEDILDGSNKDSIMDIHKKRMAGEISSMNYSMRLISKEGKVIYVEAQSSTFNFEGRPAGYITIHDVTEKQRMQEALLRSERRFRELTEMLPQAIYELDNEGKPTFMNRAGRKAFGIDEKPQGKMAYEFFSPEDMQRMRESLLRESKNIHFDENGVMQPFASQPTEFTATRTDGTKFPVIIYGTPIVENGEVTGSRGIIIDISERKAMENALRESEKKYKALVENSLDGIMIVRNNKILFANDTYCNLIGYDREFVSQSLATDFIADDEQQRALDLSKRRFGGDYSPIHDSYRLKRRDGKIIECEAYSSVIDYEGEFASFFTIHDVTENRRMQRAIAEQEVLYRTLIEKSQEGVVLTERRRFFLVNQAFCDILGYTREEIMTIYPPDLLAPDYREMLLSLHDKRINGEIDDTLNYVAIFLHKSGKRLTIEVNSSTVQIEGKNLSFTTLHDITKRIQLQEELERSEQKYRQLTEMLPQTIYELDPKGNIVYMNKTGLEKFGLPVNYMGISAFSCIVPEEHEKMMYNMRKSLEEDYYTPGNSYTAIDRKGEKFPVMIFASPMKINDVVVGTRGIILDMTEHLAMQDALTESEEKYRLLFEAESDAIFMIDVETGQILDVNPAATTIYGYSYDELLRMRNYEVSAEPEETKAATLRNDKQVLLRYHKKKDNSVFPVELSAGFTTFRNRKIQIVTSRDITENKKMQDALRENEEKYRSFIEKATDGIVITQDGQLKFSNQAMHDMMQYTSEEMMNHPFFEFVVPEDHEEMIKYHRRRMSGEKFNVLYRSHFIRKDRKIITVELNARTLDYEGKPAAFIVIRDITERLIIENELKLAKDELEELNHNLEERIKESSENLTEARTQLIRLQKENLQSQFEVLRQQVNPHFLFNSLNVLTSLIKLEPDLAEKFTEHLSKVYRYVLENKDNDLVDLKTELDFLDAYLFLLNIRFLDKLVVKIDIGKEKHDLLILPLALQLLIENAIKHNSMSKKNPLRISLSIDENNFLNVVNNLQERESYIASTGVGLKNIEHRYQLLEMPSPEFIKTEDEFIARVPLKESKLS